MKISVNVHQKPLGVITLVQKTSEPRLFIPDKGL